MWTYTDGWTDVRTHVFQSIRSSLGDDIKLAQMSDLCGTFVFAKFYIKLFVSDVAVFVLKREVKLKPTNQPR